MTELDAAPGPGKGLRSGALGLGAGVVIGLSSTAPAYSLAASLGLVVVLAGDKTPAVMLLAFVPMFLIALAYRALNRDDPDCGTTFTWAARAFGPWAGWLGGWGIIAADIIVMANLAQIAGEYSFLVFGLDDLASDTLWTTVVGIGWIALMTWVCQRGIEISARLQATLLSVELLVLAILTMLAVVKVLSGDAIGRAAEPSLGWLWPSGIGLTDLVDAVLIAVFLYWGWDTAVSVNEESRRPGHNPGRAALLSTLLLVVTYVLVAYAAVAFAGTGESGIGLANPDNAADVFAALGPAIFGGSGLGQALQVLLLLSVLTSSAASTQTTILPMARSALAMATYRALPRTFGRIHPEHRTPAVATWTLGAVSIAFYAGLSWFSQNVLTDSIAAIGLLIAFYYGLTGFACVWRFRHELQGRDLWTKGVLPGLGAVMLLAAFVLSAISYAAPDSGETTVFGIGGIFVIGIGALLLGALLMLVQRLFAPPYFRGETLPRHGAGAPPPEHPDAVVTAPAAGPVDDATVTLPVVPLPRRPRGHAAPLPAPRVTEDDGERTGPRHALFDPHTRP